MLRPRGLGFLRCGQLSVRAGQAASCPAHREKASSPGRRGTVSLHKHIQEVFVMKTKWTTQKLICTAMLAAAAGALMSLEFPLPLMPPFYKVDFSDVPSIVALFLFGPASAAWVEIIKILVKLVTVGTTTMYVGELANLIGVALFVAPVWLVYSRMGKTRKAALVSLAVSVPVRTLFACFTNAFITLPLYAKAMELPLDSVIQIVASVNPAIHDLTGFIILATIPFNVIKIGINCGVGYLLYNRLHAFSGLSKPALH